MDCTINHALCKAKAPIKGYPYVGIYNLDGKLESQISGFYPVDTMRDAFKNIEKIQRHALEEKGFNSVENNFENKETSIPIEVEKNDPPAQPLTEFKSEPTVEKPDNSAKSIADTP